jgi:hypothetical protein
MITFAGYKFRKLMAKKLTKCILSVAFTALMFPTVVKAQITNDSVNAIFDIYDRLASSGNNGSQIVINQDSRVESLLKQHFEKGKSGKNLKGWRIRIFRDNSRDARSRSESVMLSIKNNHPGIPVYRNYVAPYYYVSIGDFRTRDEAEKMKAQLKNIYSGASLIEEMINFPPL